MNEKEILEIFIDAKISSEIKLLEIIDGHSNENYIIKTPNGKFVLRKSRQDVPTERRLKHEYIILKFLEKENWSYIPKSVYYSPKKDIHIITFLKGQLMKVDELNKEQLYDLSQKMLKLNKIDCEKIKKHCKKYDHEILNIDTSYTILKKYTLEPFEYIQENCDDKELVEYLKKLVENNVVLFQSGKEETFFSHGDLPDNFLVENNNINIIDWELANCFCTKGHELGFMLRMFFLKPELKEYFIKSYHNESNYTRKELDEKIIFDIKTCLVNDILWAVKMFTEMKLKDMKGWKKYYDLSQERIKIYKDKMSEFNR